MAKAKEDKVVYHTARQNKIKMSTGERIVDVLIYVIVGLIGISTLLPFLYVIAGSFATLTLRNYSRYVCEYVFYNNICLSALKELLKRT